jgi:hypothetical protein
MERETAGGSVWELEPEVQWAEELVLVEESRRGCMVAEECWALTRWLHWIGQWDGKLGRLVVGAQALRRQRELWRKWSSSWQLGYEESEDGR